MDVQAQLSSISTSSPSEQGSVSRRKAPEITSAVLVCLVRSGTRMAHSSHLLPALRSLPLTAVAPPKDFPSLSNPSILWASIESAGAACSNPDSTLNWRNLEIR